MAVENFVLADIPVGKETVGGLGVRAVLERGRQRFSRPFPERAEHCLKPPVQSGITQIASGSFRSHPILSHVRTSIIWCHLTNHDRFLCGKTKFDR